MDRCEATALGKFIEGWKKIGKKVGAFQARALMTFFYFVILAPFAGLIRCLSDPLALKPGTQRGWRSKEKPERDAMRRAGEQF